MEAKGAFFMLPTTCYYLIARVATTQFLQASYLCNREGGTSILPCIE